MRKLTPNGIRPVALAIVALGFALRLHTLANESLWYDELLQLDIAQGSLASIFSKLPKHSALPLDYLISHFWILLGHSDFWVRVPAVVIGTLTLPVIYQLGGRLLGNRGGFLLMALLALSPLHVYYSQEVRPYALLVLGVTLTGYAFWQVRTRGRWRYIFTLQIGVLLFALAHFFASAIFIPLLGFAVADAAFNRNRKRAVRSLAVLLATGAVALLLILSLGWGKTLFDVSRAFGQALAELEKFTVDASQKPNWGTGPQVSWSFVKDEIMAPLGARDPEAALWLFNGLAGLGLVSLLRQRKYKLGLLLSLWLVLPIVSVVAFLVYRGAFFAARYIISVLPAYLILVTAGLLALPHWFRQVKPRWFPIGVFFLLSGFIFLSLAGNLEQLYRRKDKEDWRLVSHFLAQNAGPDDAIIAANAEPTMNWYYPPASVEADYFDRLENIQTTAAQTRRSWVVASVFTDYLFDAAKIEAWLGEQGAIRLKLDPLIAVYYLGGNVDQAQLLEEIRGFALPVDHTLYASLARENRRNPAVARQYYQLAIEHAPDDQLREEYQAAIEALAR